MRLKRSLACALAGAKPSTARFVRPLQHNTDRLKEELQFWLDVRRYNGATIDNPAYQIEVNVDASETGYGATLGSTKCSGTLPTHLIGTSSTLREVWAVILSSQEMLPKLVNRRVKYNMDSQPAVANLTKGGGDKPTINDAIKTWWLMCEHNKIEPSYEWIPREENTEADELSKANEFDTSQMQASVEYTARQFAHAYGLGVHLTPSYNAIDSTMTRATEDDCTIALVVPEWQAQGWWPLLMTQGRPCLRLGTTHEVYHTTSNAQTEGFVHNLPKWNIWIVIFDPSQRCYNHSQAQQTSQ